MGQIFSVCQDGLTADSYSRRRSSRPLHSRWRAALSRCMRALSDLHALSCHAHPFPIDLYHFRLGTNQTAGQYHLRVGGYIYLVLSEPLQGFGRALVAAACWRAWVLC